MKIKINTGTPTSPIFTVVDVGSDAGTGKNSHVDGYNTVAAGDSSNASGFLSHSGYGEPVASILSTTKMRLVNASHKFEIGDKVYVNQNVDTDPFTVGTITAVSTTDVTFDKQIFLNTGIPSHLLLYKKVTGATKPVTAIGQSSQGNRAIAIGDSSHAQGYSARATGDSSYSQGRFTNATGIQSHAEGLQTLASGANAHAEGSGTTAGGISSHAEGNNTVASAHYSHAEGSGTQATNYSAHAEGSNTLAGGDSSHAEGVGTIAGGDWSHAEGVTTQARDMGAHAEGVNTIAWGGYTHAEGSGTLSLYGYVHPIISSSSGAKTVTLDITSHGLGVGYEVGIKSYSGMSMVNYITAVNGAVLTLRDPFPSLTYIYLCVRDGEESRPSHAEGTDTLASGDSAHSEGISTSAIGNASHAEGDSTLASGVNSHAEGYSTKATNASAHAEGISSQATGYGSHAEGSSTISVGDYSHAEGNTTTAEGVGSHAEGNSTSAIGESSHAEGNDSFANGLSSHAEGNTTTAQGIASHAEGSETNAIGESSHAEGRYSTANGPWSHAEGYNSAANNTSAHAEGDNTIASGLAAHAEGLSSTAAGNYSHSQNTGTNAQGRSQTAIGEYNLLQGSNSVRNTGDAAFIIGNGTSGVKSNAFRVNWEGAAYGKSAYNSTGADYSEFFEWLDGNENSEDRVGYFVTLDGDKIRKATSLDNFIIGVVSSAPAIVGDSHNDSWSKKYLTDDWGRPLTHYVTYPEVKDEHGNVTDSEYSNEEFIINPDYDPDEVYIPREQRKEWSTVGLIGKLLVYDDGTCEINGFCQSNDYGIATPSTSGYRVMKRISESIIQVLVK